MEKTYSILIQFGDGKPVTSKIRAKNGMEAQDKALALNPGARSIRITGVLEVHRPTPKPPKTPKQTKLPTPVTHPLFTDVPQETLNKYVYEATSEEKFAICEHMSNQGFSKRAIAKQLEIAESTIRRWTK